MQNKAEYLRRVLQLERIIRDYGFEINTYRNPPLYLVDPVSTKVLSRFRTFLSISFASFEASVGDSPCRLLFRSRQSIDYK